MLSRMLLVLAVAVSSAVAEPDPATYQRYGAGYRYSQDGWIVVHIEGAPYERGVQHGRLLAPEIERYVRCFALQLSNNSPAEGWKLARTLTDTVFLRGFDREFLDEMKGIADGASAAGARFDDRRLDLTDIAALNLWPELESLDGANAARPTGLEGVVFPHSLGTPDRPAQEGHCSAFAATGKATKDGHAIIGHITMFGLYPSDFYNVWLDVKPEHGHRLTMQSYPAGIYSGMDYYLNDAGIAMVETTIDQTRFDPAGTSLASRARKAMQYAETLDAAVAMLKDGNNGLYNNEWLLADMNTDEIAMFELATHSSKLWRSGKNEWFGGTEGFYWGCNNAKDLEGRLESIAAVNDRPKNMVWHPSDRDLKWLELYGKFAGQMDEQFARTAFTTSHLCASHSVDAKFTTAALAKTTQSWCLFGPPLGRTWLPTLDESTKYKDVRPLVSNPWTLLGPALPLPAAPTRAADLFDPAASDSSSAIALLDEKKKPSDPPTEPAWHGTILPNSDADLWLATAFPEFESIVSRERGLVECSKAKCLCDTDSDKVAVSLFAARSRYLAGVRGDGDVALAAVKQDYAKQGWYQIASGKGVLVLSELRRLLGDGAFITMMDEFGRAHAGKTASTAEFTAAASKAAGRDLSAYFQYWLTGTGLPQFELIEASVAMAAPTPGSASAPTADVYACHAVLKQTGGVPLSNVEATLEYQGGESTQIVKLDESGRFELRASHRPRRLVVDKYARLARGGNEADLTEYRSDLTHTLIVIGSLGDVEANKDAAEICQRSIRTTRFNVIVPMKQDRDVSDRDLATNHLILIGRPATNSIGARVAPALPVSFGPASFVVRSSTRAHPDSAVIAAGVNPFNPRLTVVAVAGNSASSTYLHASEVATAEPGCQVRVFDPSGKATSLVMPDPKLVRDFPASDEHSKPVELGTLAK